jgi:hypothetical protein
MGNDWTYVPPVKNMNRLQFKHLGFLFKPVYGVELVIFHLDQVLILLARCFVDMWFLTKQLLVLFRVQHILDLVWKLID